MPGHGVDDLRPVAGALFIASAERYAITFGRNEFVDTSAIGVASTPCYILRGHQPASISAGRVAGNLESAIKSEDSIGLSNICINADVPYEVRHWAKQFGVSNEQVRAAIEQVGPFVGAVCLHLKDRIHPDNSWYPRAEINP